MQEVLLGMARITLHIKDVLQRQRWKPLGSNCDPFQGICKEQNPGNQPKQPAELNKGAPQACPSRFEDGQDGFNFAVDLIVRHVLLFQGVDQGMAI